MPLVEKPPKYIFEVFWREFNENKALHDFLKKHNLKYQRLLGWGKSSWIVVVKKKNELYTIKLEKKNATRHLMVEKEAKFLRIVNKYGIGLKIVDYDVKARCVMWRYVKAKTFRDWIKTAKPKKIRFCVKDCLKQARILDKIGIDHGQLAGAGTNIIVKPTGKPVIVDFEKASDKRKPHNYNVLVNFFFNGKSWISKKILDAYFS